MNLTTISVDDAQKMRNEAITIFELTKGFTTRTTDDVMMCCLEMANYVIILTNNIDKYNDIIAK